LRWIVRLTLRVVNVFGLNPGQVIHSEYEARSIKGGLRTEMGQLAQLRPHWSTLRTCES
jgi:hypothetical protein